ncbi:MAG: uncharacterized protein A8A55_0465 [Amphiamblys sp. WSBS2006]|nr:MAG: uncharacterized protein A8A55_0465 [Amphiamblys sp. WSBS2006]
MNVSRRVLNGVFFSSLAMNLLLLVKHRRTKHFVSPSTQNIPEEGERQELSHIVIPFHWKDVGEVEKTIRSWGETRPCFPGDGAPRPSVLFYSSDDIRRTDRIEDMEGRINAAVSALPVSVLGCFCGFEIRHANLTQRHEIYYEGKRLMLEKLIKGKTESSVPFRYVFYMDTATVAIRGGWIAALSEKIKHPNEPFWMKGSSYRGSDKNVMLMKETALQKMNGNAIYNLSAEDGFKAFFERMLKPYVLRREQSNRRDFDSDFYDFLHDLEQLKKTRKIMHKFVYTELIQDHSRSSYRVGNMLEKYPETYFVHGGYPR